MNDAFIEHVQALLRQKEQERESLNAQLQGVQRALFAVNTDVAKYRAVLDLYENFAREGGEGAEAEPSISLPEAAGAVEGPPMRGSVAQLSYNIMSQHGSRMSIPDLIRELRAVGKLKSAAYRGDYATVYRTLSRDRRFRKVAPGEFEIVPEPRSVLVETSPASVTSAH